jgi:hypothetical protein
MNDLASLTNAPKTIEWKGKTYKVHPLDLEDHGLLQAWLDEQTETHVFGVLARQCAKAELPVEVLKFMSGEAMKQCSRDRVLIGTPEADSALQGTTEGKIYLTFLAVSKGDKSFTLKDAREFANKDARDTLERMVAAADAMESGDPKSEDSGSVGSNPNATE